MTGGGSRRTARHLLELAPLALGFGALVVGHDVRLGLGALLDAIVSPPVLVRVALAIACRDRRRACSSARRSRAWRVASARGGHLVTMLRGIRLAFLALAASRSRSAGRSAAPLPFVVALIIAGIDVIETSFLLIVVRREPPAQQ